MSSEVRLWLDDQRPCPEGWRHAKTAHEAIVLMAKERIFEASLDHDLGHCSNCTGCKGYRSSCGCSCHWTGYTVVIWMASTGIWPATKPMVHSANPSGAANMAAVIESYYGGRIAVPVPQRFGLSWKEQAEADQFQQRHSECRAHPVSDIADGYDPSFQYRFVHTGIGTSVELKCLFCKHVKNITDHESW